MDNVNDDASTVKQKWSDVTLRKRSYTPVKLSKLCSAVLNQVPKVALNAIVCENKYTEWKNSSLIPSDICVAGSREPLRWFSQPSVDKNGSARFHFIDACHILTCLRTKICTTGIAGLKKEARMKAAESESTMLNVAIVIECVDKQSVAYAKRVFAEDVELFMRCKEFEKEAEFVRLIRRWYEAEDDSNLSAFDRCRRRIELRTWLLEEVDLAYFPPANQYVKGIPIVSYEALLVHIERKLHADICIYSR